MQTTKPNPYNKPNMVRAETNRIEKILTPENEINELYQEIKTRGEGFMDFATQKIIRIGELLTNQKQALGKDYRSWIENNLPFGERQAQKYALVYRNHSQLNLIPKNQIRENMGLDQLARLLSDKIPASSPEQKTQRNADRMRLGHVREKIRLLEEKIIKAKAKIKEYRIEERQLELKLKK